MRIKLLILFAFLLCFAGKVGAQTNIQSGPTNPTFCQPGSLFYNTTSAAYQQCGPANTWTQAGGITSVATLPGTCTVGAGFILPNGQIFTCGPLANQYTTAGSTSVRSSAYTFSVAPSVLSITANSQSGSNATYTYTLTSGTAPVINTWLVITGMTTTANNGSFQVTATGAGTFTVVNAAGVTHAGDTGTGNFGNITASPNSTLGLAVYTGTDACAVYNSAIGALAGKGGEFFSKNGIYYGFVPTQESTGGYTHWYCIATPANAGSANQYSVWHFTGETPTSVFGVGSLLAQAGTILYVTQAAETTASGGQLLDGWWARPDVANSTGNDIFFENWTTLFHDNQRGNENQWDMYEADTFSFRNTVAAFAAAWGQPGPSTSYALATGPSNVGGTNARLLDSGYVTTRPSRGATARFDNTWAIGMWYCYDDQGDHTTGVNINAELCNYAARRHGSAYYSQWMQFYEQGNKFGILIQDTNATGIPNRFDLIGYHVEQDLTGPFTRQYDITESTNGSESGIVSYAKTNFGGIPVNTPNIFNGGGGKYFTSHDAGNGTMQGPLFASTYTNTTAVTATNPSAATILQEIPLLSGTLNLLNQAETFHANGVFTTAAGQTPTLTFVLQLCTAVGGTGTCVAQATWVTAVTTTASTNNPWSIDAPITTSAIGATGTLVVGGYVTADLGATPLLADTVQANANTGSSAATNLTVAQFLSLTVTMSSANAGNSVKSLQMYLK